MNWWQRKVGWPNSRQSWRECLGVAFLLLAAGAVWWFRDRLLPWQQLLLGALLPVGAALVLRHSWEKLLGPVLFYDLVRTTRRGRHIVLRCVYAGALLLWFFVFFAYSAWLAHAGNRWEDVFKGGSIKIKDIPEFARAFFLTFLAVQYGAVLLLTPVYVAGAISEEREFGTLKLLLSTELSSREIVLSKLVSRLANLTLLLLTGLPILSLTQFLGGVDPNQVLLGFAATGLTMFSLGSLSLFLSILPSRPQEAVFRTYFWTALFLSVGAFAPLFCCGNPFTILYVVHNPGVLQHGDPTARPLNLSLGVGAAVYMVFHALAAVVFCVLSILTLDRLRSAEPPPVKRPTEPGESEPEPGVSWPLSDSAAASCAPGRASPVNSLGDLPPVTEQPMLWKELNLGQELRFQRMHPGLLLPVVVAAFVLFIMFLTIFSDSLGTGMTSERVNQLWVKPAGTSLACLMFLLVMFFAASSVSQEREWETLDSLLTTPLERDAILTAKWLASLWGVRQLWWWLGGVWGIGVLTGALSVLAVPLLLLAWGVFAAFVASLGLFFSVICRTSQRATIAALLVCLLVGAGPWLLAGDGQLVLTPPTILNALAFRYGGTDRAQVLAALAWLPCYAASAWVLWMLSCARFHPDRTSAPRRSRAD